MEENEKHVDQYFKRLITRRQAIKAGGLAALGLAFSKPVIKSIYPKSIFASSYGGGSSEPSPGGGTGGGGGPVIMWMQIKKLLAGDGVAGDDLGISVSISGDFAVVGAISDDDSKGAAYIFRRDEGGLDNWGEIKKLTASDGAANDKFGVSVAIDGDTVIVGAIGDDDLKGSASIFRRDEGGPNNWGEVKKLTPPTSQSPFPFPFPVPESFGTAVAISGDTAVVGAALHDFFLGSVFVYRRDEGGSDNWGQVKKLTAPLPRIIGDEFGISVAIDEDAIIVGAAGESASQGAVYVFVRNLGGVENWGQEDGKLTANDGAAGDGFGTSVDIDGDTAIIGAVQDDDNGGNSGSAYAFVRSAGVWSQQDKLTALDSAASDNFGESVAINGDTAVVGAVGNDSDRGSAYIFKRGVGGPNNWGQISNLIALDGTASDRFGGSVAISQEDTVVVGASGDDDSRGAAYIFKD